MSKLKRYQELDSLRGIAAIMVVFFHFTMEHPQKSINFTLGMSGVDLFFIISGFVIFLSTNKITKGSDFAINRASRLYPTYWIAVSLTFCLIIINNFLDNKPSSQIPFGTFLANITMFQSYMRFNHLDGPYWTMNIEMLFYMMILFLIHFKLLKHITTISTSICLIVVILFNLWPNNFIVDKLIRWLPILKFYPLFFAGILFNKALQNKNNNSLNYLLLFFCFICQILLFKSTGRFSTKFNHTEYTIILSIYFSLFILFINNKLKHIVSGPLLFLGKISYALYLIHQYLSINFIIPILMKKFHISFWIASFGFALPTSIFIASFITYYIEVPASGFLKRKLYELTLSKNNKQCYKIESNS